LAHLSDDHLLRTFQAVPRDVLTLALIGADKALIRRITQNIPRREAKRIKRSLRLDGPMRLEDIEMAKRRVAQIAAEIVTREAR
jgi:flagellar motor switch protein FliG